MGIKLLPVLWLGLFFTGGLSSVIQAQELRPEVQEVRRLYEAVEFEKAIEAGRRLVSGTAALTPEELAFVHRYLALSFYNVGKLDSAEAHFLSLLSLEPAAELDPVRVSPKIIAFFKDLKARLARERAEGDKPVAYTRYVLVEDPRPGAAWRSALLPGWGQWYKGQKMRAYLFGGAFWLSAVATGIAFLQEDRAHEQYLNSTTAPEIEKNYDTFNRWYKTRRVLTLATGVLWAFAVGDALWSGAPRTRVRISHHQGNTRLSLRISIR